MRGSRFGRHARACVVIAAGVAVVAAPVKASAGSSPWRAQTSGEQEHLHGIFALNGCDVWSVGEEAGTNTTPGQAVITATTDGGAHWKSQHFPKGAAVGTTMNRILFVDKNNGYAVGENNNTGSGESGKPNFLRTTNGGKTWIDQTSNLPAAADGGVGNEADIEGLSARGRDVWITVAIYPAAGPVGLILFSDDRGKTWTVQQTWGGSFDSISMASDGTYGWATSNITPAFNDQGLWRTTNGGNTWTMVATTSSSAEQVFAISDTHAVIVEEGTIEYTLNGTTLNTATIPAQVAGNTLTDVSIGDHGVGYATGELSGGLLKTEDGGMTWTWQDSNISGLNTYNGVTVAHDTKFAWITGEGGSIGANTAASKACHK